MRRILQFAAVAALAGMALSGCTANIFSSMDPPPDPPSDANMLESATTDLAGFLEDVDTYLDDGTLSGDTALAAATALSSTYTDAGGTFTVAPTSATPEQQEASARAGTIRLLSSDDTTTLVNNFSSLVGDLTVQDDTGTTTLTPESALETLFADTAGDIAEFTAMLDVLSAAANDFSFFAQTDPATNDPGFTSGEEGDIAQMAVLSIVVDTARGLVSDADLYEIVNGTKTFDDLAVTEDPLDQLDAAGGDLNNILTYVGFPLDETTNP